MAMRDEIAEGFERLLRDVCSPDVTRAIELGGDHQQLWQVCEESGFLDAMVSESAGGAGLDLAAAAPIAELSGGYFLPLPVAETMVLRGLLSDQGAHYPNESLAFGGDVILDDGALHCSRVVSGFTADHVIVEWEGETRILPQQVTDGVERPLGLACPMRWSLEEWQAGTLVTPTIDLRAAQALVHSLQAVGALEAVFAKTLAYANDRVQFGRPIGKFQAIQHQLAVMSEHVFATRMAVDLAAMTGVTDRLRVGIAKARTSQAATEVSAIAHAIHGAIGFTAEFDLQMLTRRLHCWRRAAGSEAYWHEAVGRELLAGDGMTLDLLRRASEPI